MELLFDDQSFQQQQQAFFRKVVIPHFQEEDAASWKIIHNNMVRVMKHQLQQNTLKSQYIQCRSYSINQKHNKLSTFNNSTEQQHFIREQQSTNKLNNIRSQSHDIKSFRKRLQSSFFSDNKSSSEGPFNLFQINSNFIPKTINRQQQKDKNCDLNSASKSALKSLKNVFKTNKRQITTNLNQKTKNKTQLSPLNINFTTSKNQNESIFYCLQQKQKLNNQGSKIKFQLHDIELRLNRSVIKIKKRQSLLNLQRNYDYQKNKQVTNKEKGSIFPILYPNLKTRSKILSENKQIGIKHIAQKLQPKLVCKHNKSKSANHNENQNDLNGKLQIRLNFHKTPLNSLHLKTQQGKLQIKNKNYNNNKSNSSSYNRASIYLKQPMTNSVNKKILKLSPTEQQSQILSNVNENQNSKRKHAKGLSKNINHIRNDRIPLRINRK